MVRQAAATPSNPSVGFSFVAHLDHLEAIARKLTTEPSPRHAEPLRAIAADLRYHMVAEAIATRLSSDFLAMPHDRIDHGIEVALESLCRHAGTGRAYVFLLDAEGACLDQAMEWCAEGVEGHDFSNFAGVPVTAFPWSMRQFRAGETVIVEDPEALPPEAAPERGACDALSIKSYINVPLLHCGAVLGWLGFDAVDAPRVWSMAEQRWIGLAGEVFVNGLLRKWAESRLHKKREFAEVTISSIRDAVFTTDLDGVIQYANPAALALVGAASDAVGQRLADILTVWPQESAEEPVDLVANALAAGQQTTTSDETVAEGHDGVRCGVEDTTTPLRDADGEMFGAVVVLHDVTEERQAKRRISFQARHDALTKLYNRYEFERQLDELVAMPIEEARRHALIYIDLDGFKQVNDTAGHATGDQVLRDVAGCLLHRLRQSDVAARIGGDEFAIILRDCPMAQAAKIANDLVRSVAALEIPYDGGTCQIGASAGICDVLAGDAPALVISTADKACYRSKTSGGGRVTLTARDGIARPGPTKPG